ncbi:NUDIX hydrolase [Sphingomonas melonis]|uniref:NUDIX hydrolase n=1 Tax=Sphingomonas melonis TaxID=152682 RepID=UPI0035C7B45E
MMPAGSLDADSVYGYCGYGVCNAPIVSRTRGIPTQDRCARGHTMPASATIKQRQQAYVCGFMFDPLGGLVVLVEKNRPAWQAGLLNGVGGKIEPQDATIHAAMAREFHEEAGVSTQPADWEEFATLVGPDYKVHMLRTFSDAWHRVATQETEAVKWFPVSALRAGAYPIVDQLAYLVPLALAKRQLRLPIVFQDGEPDEARVA